MENPKFQIKRSTNNQFYFVLRAKGNGEIILKASETYLTKQGCENGIASVKVNAQFDSRYNRSNLIANYTFNLEASNGKILGNSESYATSTGRDNGIEAVKRDAPNAPTEDLS